MRMGAREFTPSPFEGEGWDEGRLTFEKPCRSNELNLPILSDPAYTGNDLVREQGGFGSADRQPSAERKIRTKRLACSTRTGLFNRKEERMSLPNAPAGNGARGTDASPGSLAR